MIDWNNHYDGIDLALEERIVRVKNEEALKVLLKGKLKASMALSKHLRKEYEAFYHEPLQIAEKSLAVEIYQHFLMQEIALKLQKVFKRSRFLKRVIRSTRIIDCGEKIEDSNRFIWDFMSHFVRLK